MFQKAKELGLDTLTDEETAAITEEAQQTLDSYREYYQSMAEQEAEEDSTVDVEKRTDELYQDFLEDTDLSEEKYIDLSIENAILEKVYNHYIELCDKSDDAYKAYYDSQVEEQKAADEADPETAYQNYANGGYPVNVYVPSLAKENNKICRDIYIGIDEESINKILELSYNTDSAMTAEEIEEKVKEIRTPALKKIREKAEEAYEKAKNGEDFAELVKEYSDGYVEGGENTYDVSDNGSYDPDFLKAAMQLKNIGDISGIVATDYGFHIIQYSAEPEIGPIPYDKIKDSLQDAADESIEGEYWKTTLDDWLNEANVTRISFIDGEGNDISESSSVNPVMIVVICIVAGVIVALVIVLVLRKKKTNSNTEKSDDSTKTDNTETTEEIQADATASDEIPDSQEKPESASEPEDTSEDKAETDNISSQSENNTDGQTPEN